MSEYLLVDANALGYAAHNSTVLTTADGREVQAAFHMLNMIKRQMRENPSYDRVLFLWDNRAYFRYEIYPEYKGKREDTPAKKESRAAYKEISPTIKSMLDNLGALQIDADGFEADDVAAYLSRSLVRQGHIVKLITGDGDWKQLINPSVSWSDPRMMYRTCHHVTFESVTGYATTQKFLEAKALEGDSSDNITGVPGIGSKTAMAIMQHFGSVKELFIQRKKLGEFTKENLPNAVLSRARKKLNDFTTREGFSIYYRNMKLMNLLDESRDKEVKRAMNYQLPQKCTAAFFDQCDDMNFNAMLSDMPAWENLF